MTRKFCAKCGREGDFEGAICPECRSDSVETKVTTVDVCRKCGRWRDGKRWMAPPAPEAEEHEVVCPDCIKGPDYKEAILQLRSRYIDDYFSDALDVAERVVEAERKKNKHVIVRVKGHDLEFTNGKVATKAANAIAKHFGIKPERTGKLMTYDHKKGREVVLATLLLRLPDVRVGDMVKLDKVYTVTKVGALVLLESEGGQKKKVTHRDLKKFKLR